VNEKSLSLGPVGVRALVALCSHVLTHGTFAKDGKRIARAFIGAAGRTEEVLVLLRSPEARSSAASAKRLREAVAELDAAQEADARNAREVTPRCVDAQEGGS